jgi:hypothetical protein
MCLQVHQGRGILSLSKSEIRSMPDEKGSNLVDIVDSTNKELF